jgi:hypothetical protein
MIDGDARRLLSQDIRRLVTGRMTNDAFDDVYYDRYESSTDRAVRKLATFCYSLYSSDLLWPYRLRGRQAVDSDTRRTAARCVLLLRSGQDYEWPSAPYRPWSLSCLSLFLGVPAGAALSFLWLSILIDGWDHVVGSFAVVGILLLAVSIAGIFYRPPITNDWQSVLDSGDFEVWPFLRSRDFDDARKSCPLLGVREQ